MSKKYFNKLRRLEGYSPGEPQPGFGVYSHRTLNFNACKKRAPNQKNPENCKPFPKFSQGFVIKSLQKKRAQKTDQNRQKLDAEIIKSFPRNAFHKQKTVNGNKAYQKPNKLVAIFRRIQKSFVKVHKRQPTPVIFSEIFLQNNSKRISSQKPKLWSSPLMYRYNMK